MRIRVKLTILILVSALAPLLAVKFVDGQAIRRLSGRVSDQVTAAVTRRVEQELTLHTERITARMGEELRTVSLMVRSQAQAFEDAGPPATETPDPSTPELGAPPARTAAEFDDAPEEIPGLREQRGWRAGAGRVPEVSYELPVFVPAPGLTIGAPAVAAQVNRLLDTADMLSELSLRHRELARSQYVCFTNGLHMAYPGKGGYPAGFDGRARPWYAAGLGADRPVWIGPIVDAVTGETRMTCSAPVRNDAGEVIGVTGVDVSLQSVLEVVALPPELALGSEVLVVTVPDGDPEGPGGGGAAARPGDGQGDGPSEGPSEGPGVVSVLLSIRDGLQSESDLDEPVPLESADEAGLDRLTADLVADRNGVVSMPRDERASFWAYAKLGPGVGVVIIVPNARVSAIVEGVRQDLRTMSRETNRSTAAAALLVIALAFLFAYLLGRTLSRPIRRLADAASAVAGGDLDARAVIRPRRDEIGKLASAFNQMVPALADRMRMRESLALATELQQRLLPSGTPAIPGFDVFGVSVYCDETGGDYFDYLQPITMGEGRFGLVVGDVTGHGISAALIMTSARALIQSHARSSGAPGEVLERVNETIATDASHGRFITLLLLMIDTGARRLSAANAGHDPGVVYRAGVGVFDEMPLGGLPLGIDADERYQTRELDYPEPGDIYLIATDGVWEMRDPGGAFYGKERMRGVIKANAHRPAPEIGRALLDDLDSFRGTAARQDDVTFIVIKATDGAE